MSRCQRNAALFAVLLAIPSAGTAQQAPESPGWQPAGAGTPRAGFVHLEDSGPSVTPAAPAPEMTWTVAAPAPEAGIAALFQPGATSTQVMGGAYFSIDLGPRSPAFNYVPISIRQGVMLTCPEDHWWGHGNYECLFDITGAAITSNYGNWFAGPSFYLRANWITPGCCAVPYFQLGTGAVWNDAYKDQSQRAIGEGLEFYQHVELGLKYFVAPNMSLDLEGGLQHLSNGGLAKRNYGMNALGATVGLTYYFPNGQ